MFVKFIVVCTILLSLVSYGVSIINFKNFGLGIPKSINKSSKYIINLYFLYNIL